MIARITGKADGADILFTRSPDGAWTCQVPANASGQYVVELTAEDEAGNASYLAKVLFTVDPAKLCVRIEWADVSAEAGMAEIVQTVLGGIHADAGLPEIRADANMTDWDLRVVRSEKCGR